MSGHSEHVNTGSSAATKAEDRMAASSECSGTSALPAAVSHGSDAALRAELAAPGSSGHAVRLACRSGALAGHTSGLAPGLAQANLVILPREYAFDFLAFCTRNPKPCPLLEVTEVGSPACPATAPAGCDLRTDLPRYRVWRHGKLAEEVTDIRHLWPDVHASSGGDSSGAAASGASAGPTAPAGAPPAPAAAADARGDWVGFLLGCSFSFEEALLAAGLPVRHLQENKPGAGASSSSCCDSSCSSGASKAGALAGLCEPLAADPRNVPMYRTCVPTTPAGPFSGPLVVSMRPMTPAQAQQAASVTSAFQRVHGRPVYAGDAAGLGIADVGRPDYGDAVTIRPGEVPVFWACGVTPQAALLEAKIPIAITHAPGHMLVLDTANEALAGPAELDVAPYTASAVGPGKPLPVNHVALPTSRA